MKQMFKWSAILAVALTAVIACEPKDPDPTPGPEPEVKAPVADFTYAADGLKVTFTNTSTDATSYKWTFGDEESSKEESPVHEYAAAGDYTVTLTAANANGDTNKKEVKISVKGKVQAYFEVSEIEGRAGAFGMALKFDATSSANATSIVWDFGDGTTATDFVVEHKFPEYSTYTVKATVSDASGASDVFSQDVTLVAKNELLKGGSFEEEDAEFWSFKTAVNPDWFGPDQYPGHDSWVPSFGYTADKPAAGQGGCFRANGEFQLTQAAFNFTLYQAVELEAGDVIRFGLDMKWAEDSCNDGLFWIGICNSLDAVTSETQDTAPEAEFYNVEMFNYWAAAGTADWGDGGASVPAYDGNLEGTEAWNAANAELGMGYSGAESVEYTVQNSGTFYFYINYRNVWGNYWGKDVLLDNASLKIIL